MQGPVVVPGTSAAVTQAAIAAVLRGRYGTGADGDLTVSGTRTETQHRAYLTLDNPAAQILQPTGWFVVARRLIDVAGTVRRNGITATVGTAAANITLGAFGGSANSATAGVTGAASGAGGSTTNPYFGGTGGNGGAGSGGAGGVSSAFSTGTQFVGRFDVDPWAALMARIASLTTAATDWATGQGGSGGGGNGVQTGGGGGSAAGGIVLCAPIIRLRSTAVLQAIGGNGAPGQASNCGGGGGGGGGVIILLCEELIQDAGSSISVAGGTGGSSGGGSGVQGSDGGAGKIFLTGIA